MAKVRNSELRALIEDALNEYVSAQTVDPDNICHSVAEIIVRAINDAGIIAIRDETDRTTGANAAVVVRLRQTPAATG
jgi:hypothetical protein